MGRVVKGETRMTNAKEVLEYMAWKEERERNMTNDEWRRTCSTEEFAEWLFETFDLCGAGCSNCFVQKMCFVDNDKMPTEMFVEWLKQPHH